MAMNFNTWPYNKPAEQPTAKVQGKEAFWRVASNVNVPSNVECYINKDTTDAAYRDNKGRFHHEVEILSNEHFTIRPSIVASGPWAGAKALVIVPSPRFPFQKLPAELREMVYDELASIKGNICPYYNRAYRPTGHPAFGPMQWPDRPIKWTAILRTNRAIYREARKSFYVHKHFLFTGMVEFNHFMRRIGDAKRFLAQLTVKRCSTRLLPECFTRLCHTSGRLQRFTFNLPADFRGTLVEHLDAHWSSLSIYLLEDKIDPVESARRLGTIVFVTGAQRPGIGINKVTKSGRPGVARITEDVNELCRKWLRKKLLDHFETHGKIGGGS